MEDLIGMKFHSCEQEVERLEQEQARLLDEVDDLRRQLAEARQEITALKQLLAECRKSAPKYLRAENQQLRNAAQQFEEQLERAENQQLRNAAQQFEEQLERADLRRQLAEALGLPEDSAAAEIVSAARSLTEMLAAAAAEVQALRAALAADWPGVRAWLETAQETPEDAADWTPAHRPGKGDAR